MLQSQPTYLVGLAFYILVLSWQLSSLVIGKLAEAAKDVAKHGEGWLIRGLLYRTIIVACQLSCLVRR